MSIHPLYRRQALLNLAYSVADRYRFEQQDEAAHVQLRDSLTREFISEEGRLPRSPRDLAWFQSWKDEEEQFYSFF